MHKTSKLRDSLMFTRTIITALTIGNLRLTWLGSQKKKIWIVTQLWWRHFDWRQKCVNNIWFTYLLSKIGRRKNLDELWEIGQTYQRTLITCTWFKAKKGLICKRLRMSRDKVTCYFKCIKMRKKFITFLFFFGTARIIFVLYALMAPQLTNKSSVKTRHVFWTSSVNTT